MGGCALSLARLGGWNVGINLVNVQVWGRRQQEVLQAVRLEFGRFFSGDERTLKKHLGFKPEDHKAMLSYRADVREWVKDLGEGAALAPEVATVIGPALNGWVGVYDAAMDGQNGKLAEAAARRLSEILETSALTVMVAEGRSFLYVLGQGGVTYDWYLYGPDVPAPGSPSVHAEALAKAVGKPDLTPALTAALSELRQPTGEAAGYEQLTAVASTLGIRNTNLGYRALALAGPQMAEGWPEFLTLRDADYASTPL